jgi:type II secretion system protein G
MRRRRAPVHASLERLRKRREEEGEEGFTLIELLIVIVILGILAAIVVFAVQNLTNSSSQASCGSDYKTVETAIEAYKAQVGFYPEDPAGTGGWTVVPVPPPAAYNGNRATMGDLLGTATSPAANNPIGPWLKDVPQNPGHYLISVSPGPTPVISVTPAGTFANPCAGAT